MSLLVCSCVFQMHPVFCLKCLFYLPYVHSLLPGNIFRSTLNATPFLQVPSQVELTYLSLVLLEYGNLHCMASLHRCIVYCLPFILHFFNSLPRLFLSNVCFCEPACSATLMSCLEKFIFQWSAVSADPHKQMI